MRRDPDLGLSPPVVLLDSLESLRYGIGARPPWSRNRDASARDRSLDRSFPWPVRL